MNSKSSMKEYARLGRLGEEDEKLRDYQYWSERPAEELFSVAWELVVDAWKLQGKDINELRFQRSVTRLERR